MALFRCVSGSSGGGDGVEYVAPTTTYPSTPILTDRKPKQVMLTALLTGGTYLETEVYDEDYNTSKTRLFYNGATSPVERNIGASNSFIAALNGAQGYGLYLTSMSNVIYFTCMIKF